MENNRNIEEITFFGGQNSDTALEFIPKGDFLYALNIVNNSSGVGGKGIVKNIKGNLQIPFLLPDGQNKCIGIADDAENNKFYFFNWNELNFHGIYQFNGQTRAVLPIILNQTDTANTDILKFNKDFLILHADVARNELLYWVDGWINARKTNINKCLDKSSTGYGLTILESYINAYKKTTDFAPTVSYFSDTTKPFNRLYGALRRFAVRFIFDDGEKSNWSDFSSIALPDKEPFTGINVIPSNNNGLKITMETGDLTVIKIEIGMQSTTGEANDDGTLQWKLIATLNKKRLNITNNSVYTYSFYNDSVYPVTSYEKIIRPYNFLPKTPLCQSVVKNALVYTGGKEGFDNVDVDASVTVEYKDLFIADGTENIPNSPKLLVNEIPGSADYMRHHSFVNNAKYIDLDGVEKGVTSTKRANAHTVTVGNDVKEGNEFRISLANGGGTFNIYYKANKTDTARTVASALIAQIVSTTRIIRRSQADKPPHYIYDITADIDQNITFSFIILDYDQNGYYASSGSVFPVLYNTLKDTGESISNQKLGGSVKYGYMYEDLEGGRKTLTYTTDSLIVGYKTINELGGLKSSIVTLQTNHRPPIWAKYFQVVRSNDLIYQNYIQMLVQNVIDVQSTTSGEYQDLVIGSLITYNKIHPNSNLSYAFKKGDRLRLIKKTATDILYPFFETEILSYNEIVTEKIKSNIVTNGTTTVTVEQSNIDNIGRFIVVEGSEREILAAPSGTTYTLNSPLGGTEPKTYIYFEIVDTRGTIRIRKPATPIDLQSEDLPLVEIFTPASKIANGENQFFEFQKKFQIINAGTDNAYHSGSKQDQTDVLPSLIEISEGTAYVRNRELPITNSFPGAQVTISPIEDPSFSDFYPSLINDNGRSNAEDTGTGEVTFGNRMRFSNNSIEETKINGLNDFDNLDREDYPDKFGDIKRTVFDNNNIFVFKSLRTAYIPVDSKFTYDDAGTSIRAGSAQLLNPIQYLAYEGGIGNNPEAYCSNGTQKYVLYANAGVIVRIGGNGEEPISKTHFLDKEARELIAKASTNNAKIHLGFDRKLSLLKIVVEGYNEYIYFDGFNSWVTVEEDLPEETLFEIVIPPVNGVATLNNGQLTYTPNLNFVGDDHVTYRAFINGLWSEPKKVCLTYIENQNRVTTWIPDISTGSCVLVNGVHNGYFQYTQLEEIYTDDLSGTGNFKPNVETDADYVGLIYDLVSCSLPIYNVEKSQSFVRNNCGVDETGSSVPYTVPAGKYFSYISQADADAKAQADIAANGQNNANAHGTCIITRFWNVLKSQAFTRNNCGPDQTGSAVLYTVAAHTYSANTQTAADQKALDDIAANGQNYANANGTCIVTTFWNVVKSQNFTRNNCGPGQTGSSVTYTVAAHAYSASTQAAADQKALDDIAANGQNYANTNGICTLNTAVPIILTTTYDIDPTVWNGLIFLKNGVETNRVEFETGTPITLGTTYRVGDTITVIQFHYTDVFPWPPTSTANLNIKKNNVTTLYDGNKTDPDVLELQRFAYTIPADATSINIVSSGSSTASGYVTKSLTTTNNTPQADGAYAVQIVDNTLGEIAINVESQIGTNVYAYNYVVGSVLLTGKIFNQYSSPLSYLFTGEAGYSKSGNIPVGGNVVFTDVPQGSTEVVIGVGVGESFTVQGLSDLGALGFCMSAYNNPDREGDPFYQGCEIDDLVYPYPITPGAYYFFASDGDNRRVFKNGVDVSSYELYRFQPVNGDSFVIKEADAPIVGSIVVNGARFVDGSPTTIDNTYYDLRAARKAKTDPNSGGGGELDVTLYFDGELANGTILYKDSAKTMPAHCYGYYIIATDMIFYINSQRCMDAGIHGPGGGADGEVHELQMF